MAFFKKYSGTTNVRLVRMERLIWTLIYAGLLSMVLAYFTEQTQGVPAHGLLTFGVLAVVLGVLMVWIRSRLREDH
jgi:hypothetical protein